MSSRYCLFSLWRHESISSTPERMPTRPDRSGSSLCNPFPEQVTSARGLHLYTILSKTSKDRPWKTLHPRRAEFDWPCLRETSSSAIIATFPTGHRKVPIIPSPLAPQHSSRGVHQPPRAAAPPNHDHDGGNYHGQNIDIAMQQSSCSGFEMATALVRPAKESFAIHR